MKDRPAHHNSPRPAPRPLGWEYHVADITHGSRDLNTLGLLEWEAVGVIAARVDGFHVLLKRRLETPR